jgi:mono/diheme cytochrome c family protein
LPVLNEGGPVSAEAGEVVFLASCGTPLALVGSSTFSDGWLLVMNEPQAVEFYVERDLYPEKWYGRDRGGHVELYDDLPAQFQDNVNREPPFDRKPGEAPALSKDEIEDVIAFLKTLTDADLAGTLPSARPR